MGALCLLLSRSAYRRVQAMGVSVILGEEEEPHSMLQVESRTALCDRNGLLPL